jgi:hypothetical protein
MTELVQQRGTWQEGEQVITWSGTLSDGTAAVWCSEARYCPESNLYSGRTPHLTVGGVSRSFDDAVAFAAQLGQVSKWVRATDERRLVG